ncbi:MAG: FIST N-terminal domain-containing protein, partial [Acidimicrobiia bacterium]
MAAFAASLSEHPIPSAATGEAVGQVLDQLGDGPVDLALLFASASHSGAFEDICDAVRRLLRPGTFLGSTAVGVIGGAREVEARPGLSIFAARLAGASVRPLRLGAISGSDGPVFHGLPARAGGALLVLTDPFSFPADVFLDHVDRQLPGTTVIGGLASAARGPGGNRLALDDQIVSEGAVGVHLEGAIEVSTVVSQGCRPIGQAYVVTRSERNVVYELGGMAAFERLRELASDASEEDRELMRAGLHLGCVVDEHRLDFNRGDFLVRGVIGADPATGAIAVGELVPVGRT